MTRNQQRTHWAILATVAASFLVTPGIAVAAPTTAEPIYDCSKLDAFDARTSSNAYPEAVTQCINRGWSPPKDWKVNDGKNPGIRAGGSTGLSVGTISKPEATPQARNYPASVSKERMKFSCNFPPRVNISLSGIKPEIPKGSCWEFFSGLLKDKGGNTAGSSDKETGAKPGDSCPAENDEALSKPNIYGSKTAISPGSFSLSCGASMPTTSSDIALNPNPTGLAVTKVGDYRIWLYNKSGTSYVPVSGSPFPLPRYLCTEYMIMEGVTARRRTVDLTPPISQMITYNPSVGAIGLRLMSRETMDANFIPPYEEGEPEKYLILPVGGSGAMVPATCDIDIAHFQTTMPRQDIYIHSATNSSCQKLSLSATPQNDPTVSCPTGTTMDTKKSLCVDSAGKTSKPVVTDHWTYTCPDGTKVASPTGCPGAAEIKAINDSTGIEASCGTSVEAAGNANCSTSSILLSGGACEGKTLYSVLNRPNLLFPVGTSTNFYTVDSSAPGPKGMADTVTGTEYITQAQTSLFLQRTALPLTLNSGGTIRFKNNASLMMEAEAQITMSSGLITMKNGGQLVGPTGLQIQPFKPGESYTIPADLFITPIEVNVNSGITLPANYSVPSAEDPGSYIRLPADAAPPSDVAPPL